MPKSPDDHKRATLYLPATAGAVVRHIYADAQDFLRKHQCRIKAATLYESKRSMVFVAHVPATLDPVEFQSNLTAKLGEECDIEVRLY